MSPAALDEARAAVDEGLRARADMGAAPPLAGADAAEIAFDLGDWADGRAPACPSAGAGVRHHTSSTRRTGASSSRSAAATTSGARAGSTRPPTWSATSREPQFIGPQAAHARRARAPRRRPRRRARGRRRRPGPHRVLLGGPCPHLAGVGRRASASRPTPPCAPATSATPTAERTRSSLRGDAARCASRPPPATSRPVEAANLAIGARADAPGRRGDDDPALWAAAAEAWAAVGRPYDAAMARWREAEAPLSARRPRGARPPRRADAARGRARRSARRGCCSEIEGFVARARLR